MCDIRTVANVADFQFFLFKFNEVRIANLGIN